MATYPSTLDLPKDYLNEIARIITIWALTENKLRTIAYQTAGTNPKVGRIAWREPNAKNYPELVRDLLAIKNIDLNIKKGQERTSLADDLERAGGNRDALAHGVWLKVPGNPLPELQVTRGTWKPPNRRAKRAIMPERVALTIEDLEGMTAFMHTVIDRVVAFGKTVRSVRSTSQEKSGARSHASSPRRRARKVLPSPQAPSRT